MVVVLFWGWLRETQSSLPVAESEYSDWEIEESKQMISCSASKSSLEEVRKQANTDVKIDQVNFALTI